jgi:hypothetical protein
MLTYSLSEPEQTAKALEVVIDTTFVNAVSATAYVRMLTYAGVCVIDTTFVNAVSGTRALTQ